LKQQKAETQQETLWRAVCDIELCKYRVKKSEEKYVPSVVCCYKYTYVPRCCAIQKIYT
jgi:hypothetical protein